jgi:hypothetical protein
MNASMAVGAVDVGIYAGNFSRRATNAQNRLENSARGISLVRERISCPFFAATLGLRGPVKVKTNHQPCALDGEPASPLAKKQKRAGRTRTPSLLQNAPASIESTSAAARS